MNGVAVTPTFQSPRLTGSITGATKLNEFMAQCAATKPWRFSKNLTRIADNILSHMRQKFVEHEPCSLSMAAWPRGYR